MNILKKFAIFLLATLIIITNIFNTQINAFNITFRAQTKEEEFNRIIKTINEFPWFKRNNYNINRLTLPNHEFFKNIIKNPELLSTIDINHLRNIFYIEIYDASAFNKGLDKLQQIKIIVESIFSKLIPLNKSWGFKIIPKYEILLTLYGSNGSYNSLTGRIIIKTTKNGIFNLNPSNTIIHEIVHIGIEENIINKYKLTQDEKERVVDLICSKYLNEYISEYEFQEVGNQNLDPFITEKGILKNLPVAIEKYIAQYPR